jgi:SAM-dependent methyltransferase
MTDHPTDVTAERWGDTASTATLRDVFWTSSAVVARYVNRRTTGDSDADWLTWLDHLVLRPTGRQLDCLVLGCGEGWLERALAPSPAVASILAMDLSSKAVAEAERLAAEQRLDGVISYRATNLDHDALPLAAFDVVIAHSVLHHVERLEFAYEQIAAALRPGGLLVINEYVGRCRLQYGDDQLERINAIMDRLPPRFRRSAVSGEVYRCRVRPPLAVVTAVDPSEGIRSEEVLAAAAARFEVVRQVGYGGSILQPLLYELVPNFSNDDPDHRAMLELLCQLEENLVDAGVVASDFVLAFAKRRDDPALAFTLPPPLGQPAPTPPPASPWLQASPLPETGGLVPVLEHLAARVTGRADRDPLAWTMEETGRGRLRPLALTRARLLEDGPFAAALRERFRSLAVGWPNGDENPAQALYSIGTLGTAELALATTVDRLAAALAPDGAVVLLAPCRAAQHVPAEATRQRIRAAARVLPPRLDLSPLLAPPPAELDCAAVLDLASLRRTLESCFEVIHWKELGWPLLTVLVPLLAPQLDVGQEADATLLRLLCLLDSQLVDDGVLPTEFLLVLARRR